MMKMVLLKMENSHRMNILLFIFVALCCDISFAITRCYTCRSRGELGSCKDTFSFNATQAINEVGIELRPCASGWCGKMIEAETDSKEEYGVAYHRNCFQRGPSDGENRCAYTKYKSKKVYMCFCRGDLCNSANILKTNIFLFNLTLTVILIVNR